MSEAVWLHLSDWHQRGRDFDRSAVRDALLDDLEKRAEIDPRLAEIDFIVFSGDLAFGGAEEEYETAAREFLSPVLEVTRVPKSRLFLVPGNHDLDRGLLPYTGSLLQLFKSSSIVSEALSDSRRRKALLQPLDCYSQFVQSYWGAEAFQDPAYSFLAPFEIRGTRFALLGIGSAWMCGQHVENGEVADYGHLILGEPQYYSALRENAFKAADVRLGVLHHPFSWLSEIVSRREVEQALTGACHFLLRGHEHESRITLATGPEGSCAVLSAGAAYDRREYPNGYNFVHLDLEAGQGTAFLRRYDRLKGFHKDTVSTLDATPGFHSFGLPKQLGRSRSRAVAVPAPRQEAGPGLFVELIEDYRSPDILAALELYDERIPEGERFEAADIIRWLRDRHMRHLFFVAKYRSRVCGFLLMHVRSEELVAFVAYLAAEKNQVPVDEGTISYHLMEEVARLFAPTGALSGCGAILLEVDDPCRAATEKERREGLARIRLFSILAERENFLLRALDFSYLQPMLRIPGPEDAGREVPMLLMMALRPSVVGDGALSRERVMGFLDFTYRFLYPTGFSAVEAENVAYAQYLDGLYAKQTASLPERIPTLGLAQLRARCTSADH
jgi:Calcineurin-like phosphoesterase